MKLTYFALLIGVITLTGAGCADMQLPEQDTSETSEDVAANTTDTDTQEAVAPDTNEETNDPEPTPSDSTNDREEQTPADESPVVDTESEPEQEPEEEEVVEPESDQEMESFFNYSVTHDANYEAYQSFKKYSQRMNRAIVRASPAGIERYEHSEWVKYDAEGSSMVNLGVEAAGAMLEAHKAFEAKSANTESLVKKAVNLVSSYYDSIIVFELKWGVSGL